MMEQLADKRIQREREAAESVGDESTDEEGEGEGDEDGEYESEGEGEEEEEECVAVSFGLGWAGAWVIGSAGADDFCLGLVCAGRRRKARRRMTMTTRRRS